MMKKVPAMDMFLAPQKKSLHFSVETSLLSLAEPLARIFSDILEQPVNPRQTLHMLHVQLAALALLLPVGAPIEYYVLAAAWCGLALRGCARAFRHRRP